MTDAEEALLIEETAKRIMDARGGYTWELFIPAAMRELNMCGGIAYYESLLENDTGI